MPPRWSAGEMFRWGLALLVLAAVATWAVGAVAQRYPWSQVPLAAQALGTAFNAAFFVGAGLVAVSFGVRALQPADAPSDAPDPGDQQR